MQENNNQETPQVQDPASQTATDMHAKFAPREEPSSAQPACCTTDSRPRNNGKGSSPLLGIGVIVALLGIIALFILYFANKDIPGKKIPSSAVADTTGGLTVAYVNTDTLMSQYQYAIDLQKRLESLQAQKTNEYKNKIQKFESDAAAFQNEYQNYLKTGDQLTLSQQQAKEKNLKNSQSNLQERQFKLQELESQYAQQLQLQTMQESEKMTKAVYAFIRDYNEKYLHYDIILSKSFSSSPVLYGKEDLDITSVIVKGLNEEYKGLDKEEAKSNDAGNASKGKK